MKEMSINLENPSQDSVQDLLSLIRSKRRCIERLMDATQKLLCEPVENLVVTKSDGKGEDPLTLFNTERDSAMRALELYDRKISELIPCIPPAMRTSAMIEETRQEMAKSERLIIALFSADELVFSRIQDAQSRIHRMVGENRRSRESLSKFKSSWITESGEEMDQTL